MPSDHISAVWYRLGDDAASLTQYNSIATKKQPVRLYPMRPAEYVEDYA